MIPFLSMAFCRFTGCRRHYAAGCPRAWTACKARNAEGLLSGGVDPIKFYADAPVCFSSEKRVDGVRRAPIRQE